MTATLPPRTAVTTCAVPGRNHHAEDGLYICRNHLDELAGWLYDIDTEVVRLDARPTLQGNWDGARGGRLASHQAPAKINSIVHADRRHVSSRDLTSPVGLDGTLSAFGTLHMWADEIRDGRSLQHPGQWVTEQIAPGPVCATCEHYSCRRMVSRHFKREQLTVASERLFLSRHLEWAAHQPSIGQLFDDIRTLRGQLQAVNGTGPPKIRGHCPEPDCRGLLQVVKPKHSSGLFVHVGDDLLEAVECERDANHRWEAQHLIRLSVILEEQRKR